jgi:hypothetical protein
MQHNPGALLEITPQQLVASVEPQALAQFGPNPTAEQLASLDPNAATTIKNIETTQAQYAADGIKPGMSPQEAEATIQTEKQAGAEAADAAADAGKGATAMLEDVHGF